MARPRYRFTLIELLVVVAIIAILASMLLPSLNRAKSVAQARQCTNNLRTIVLGLSLYTEDNTRYFPFPTSSNNYALGYAYSNTVMWTNNGAGVGQPSGLGRVYANNYVSDWRVFFCTTNDIFFPLRDTFTSWWGVMAAPPDHRGGSYLFRAGTHNNDGRNHNASGILSTSMSMHQYETWRSEGIVTDTASDWGNGDATARLNNQPPHGNRRAIEVGQIDGSVREWRLPSNVWMTYSTFSYGGAAGPTASNGLYNDGTFRAADQWWWVVDKAGDGGTYDWSLAPAAF